jgi:hypothetical protein
MLDGQISLDELKAAMFIEASRRTPNTTQAAGLLGICMKSGYNIRNELQQRQLFHKDMIGGKYHAGTTIQFSDKRLF